VGADSVTSFQRLNDQKVRATRRRRNTPQA
jgi:hypothetical protein